MMFIPNTMPSTLAEMLEFLTPCVEDGLFDSVAYDDDESPTKIICTQGGNTILEIADSPSSPPQFSVTPFVAQNTPATGNRITCIVKEDLREDHYFCMRCKHGIVIVSVYLSFAYVIAVGKTTAGKTACISGIENIPASVSITEADRQYYTTCIGDNTALSFYTKGVFTHCCDMTSDRTILRKIPVVGERGSTDSFDGVYFRETVQSAQNGAQTIGGKNYGCAGDFAVLDE